MTKTASSFYTSVSYGIGAIGPDIGGVGLNNWMSSSSIAIGAGVGPTSAGAPA